MLRVTKKPGIKYNNAEFLNSALYSKFAKMMCSLHLQAHRHNNVQGGAIISVFYKRTGISIHKINLNVV